MQWWAWIAVGAILLGSELTLVNAQFYLVFLGVSALIVGLVSGTGAVTAQWGEWLLFAILSVVFMLGFRRQLYDRMRHKLPAVRSGPAGETITIPTSLSPGESCRLEYRGSSWSAVNGGKTVIPAGAAARISRVDGLTLVLHADA